MTPMTPMTPNYSPPMTPRILKYKWVPTLPFNSLKTVDREENGKKVGKYYFKLFRKYILKGNRYVLQDWDDIKYIL